MVYKKYIKRGEKIYGPYKYHSRKVDGKVITDYLGKHKEKSKKNLPLIFLIIGLVAIVSLVFILSYNPNFVKTITGFAVSEGENESVTVIEEDPLAFIRFIIELTKAEHLDLNRNFISDISDQVKKLDDIWSKTISDNEYVRVTFEENLTSESDITIYPRIVDGTPRIEVYEFEKSEVIAEFKDIISNQYNKVLLTNLQGSQNIFDLLILGGSLQFDHIIDPTEKFFEDCTDMSQQWTIIEWVSDTGRCAVHKVAPALDNTIADFSLAGATDVNISFSWEVVDHDVGDYINLYISNDSTTTWYHIWDSSAGGAQTSASGSENVTLEDKVTFTANMRLRVGCNSGNNEYCYFDDINVTDYSPPADDEFPQFSNYWSNNATIQGSGTAEFNVTITLTNGTAGLEIGGNNYSAHNTTTSVFNTTVSGLSEATYSYYWWSYGNGTNKNYNTSQIQYYTVNATPPDLNWPIFSDYKENPDNNTAYSFGATYRFNSTITSVNGTAGLDFNSFNYSSHNTTANEFNTTITNLGAGTYSYYWWAYGNGTSENYNTSGERSYTIATVTGEINGTINGTQGNFTSYNGSATLNIYINATNTTGYGTGKIYVNGSLYNAGTFPLYNVTNFSTGFYNITFEYDGNDNYTSDRNVWWVNITLPPDLTSPYFTGGTPENQSIMYNTALSYDINATDDVGFGCFTVNDTKFKINCIGYL